MDRNLTTHDQAGDRPEVKFPSGTSSQFTQSQYPFPIDAELTMSSNYPALPQTYTQQLHDAANSANMPTSPSQNNFAIAANGAGNGVATDPAMAPPQTPNQQSFVATASRNVDDPSDMSQTPMTGDKRKRSKVSRACDECRRKKVTFLSAHQFLSFYSLTLRRFVASTLPPRTARTRTAYPRLAPTVKRLA